MKIELFPLEKVTIDKIDIFLGMKQYQVEELFGKPEIIQENYGGGSSRNYYFGSELGLDFNESVNLEFIEFLAGHEGSLKPIIYGLSAFDTDAEKLANALKEKDSEFEDEDGYSYGFLNISVGIWREDKESIYWNTIGIGLKDYYKVI